MAEVEFDVVVEVLEVEELDDALDVVEVELLVVVLVVEVELVEVELDVDVDVDVDVVVIEFMSYVNVIVPVVPNVSVAVIT